MPDGSTVDAKLVGADPNADLAVIQVNVPADKLHPVVLADSTQVKVGQLAIAIGNPYGLSGTMTEGIISGLARSLPVTADNSALSQSGATYSIPDIIQTDAAINPGNSGGVLVNDQGQVIGVTAAIQSATNSNSGIGFVIPSAIVNRVVPSIIKTGTYEHPFIGISGVTVTNDVAAAMNLDANQKRRAGHRCRPGSPAAQAGLRGSSSQTTVSGQAIPVGGDVITAVDGHAIKAIEDLTSYLFNNTQVGQTVTLTILRQGREQTVKVTLAALPKLNGPVIPVYPLLVALAPGARLSPGSQVLMVIQPRQKRRQGKQRRDDLRQRAGRRKILPQRAAGVAKDQVGHC